jgi:hypothetical protein
MIFKIEDRTLKRDSHWSIRISKQGHVGSLQTQKHDLTVCG